MPKITLQHIFNLAWQAFIVEDGQPSVNDDGACAYLHNGRKCAIGLAIPDGHPAQHSHASFSGLVARFPGLFDLPDDMDDADLDRFQGALHDWLQSQGKWVFSKEERRKHYLNVAVEYELEIPEWPFTKRKY